jgi:hypothetical protein
MAAIIIPFVIFIANSFFLSVVHISIAEPSSRGQNSQCTPRVTLLAWNSRGAVSPALESVTPV